MIACVHRDRRALDHLRMRQMSSSARIRHICRKSFDAKSLSTAPHLFPPLTVYPLTYRLPFGLGITRFVMSPFEAPGFGSATCQQQVRDHNYWATATTQNEWNYAQYTMKIDLIILNHDQVRRLVFEVVFTIQMTTSRVDTRNPIISHDGPRKNHNTPITKPATQAQDYRSLI
ncbi:hypothetical protein TNCV_3757791 [Trichonephila clavipes]|nr:hypothetical protein TNCV_3757791 [Trichonephila clavipes]